MDGISEDGQHGLTVIAFIGSVFSPYYAWSGWRDPFNHCTVNVVLYGSPSRWAMTERGRASLERSERHIAIGPSRLSWDGEWLTIDIDETGAPLPLAVKGTVRLRPQGISPRMFYLDAPGRHRWWPMSPRSHIEVALEQPALSWKGSGYFDTNEGDEPLEEAFVDWNWSRADWEDGAAILYEVNRRDGTRLPLALKFNGSARVEPFEPPGHADLPPTALWRVARATRSDAGKGASVKRTLEDTPFYSRSVISSHLMGRPVTAMHESLSLDRLASGWARMLLPFRMPRAFW